MTINQAELLDALRIGLSWLTTPQPDSAVITHHGIYRVGTLSEGRIAVTLCPQGAGGRPVLVFNLRDAEFTDDEFLNPFTDDEVASLLSVVAQAAPVAEHWNGAGCESFSVSIDHALHPSLQAALQRYRDRCLDHKTVFCYSSGCSWLADGRALVALPEGWGL